MRLLYDLVGVAFFAIDVFGQAASHFVHVALKLVAISSDFFVDHFLQARTALDSVTTLVDAKHILLRLDDSREAAEQVAFADQIVLNKTELVSPEELRLIEARLRILNSIAPIHRAERANVALDAVLGRGGFDIERIVSLAPQFLAAGGSETATHEHQEAGPSQSADSQWPDHTHDSEIRSVSLTSRMPMDRQKVNAWLTALVAEQGQDILRAKGIIAVQHEDARLVFQAVHRLFESGSQHAWKPEEQRVSRAVFIGRKLDDQALRAGFQSCVAIADEGSM